MRASAEDDYKTGEPVDDLAERVEQLARGQYPDHYAGVEVSEGGVVLYRKPSPELDEAVRDLDDEGVVVFRDAPYSCRELERLRDEIVDDAEHGRLDDVEVSSVAVKHDGTAVEVGVVDIDKARRELTRRFGTSAPLQVVRSGPIVRLPS